MYSFEGVELTTPPLTSGIIPIEGGTPNIFLTKFEWASPSDKMPHLELTLERRYKPTGSTTQSVQTLAINFIDPNQLQSEIGKQTRQKISQEQYGRIILAYRPDLNPESLRKMVGRVASWQEFSLKTFDLLPADFTTRESTWKLIYYQGQWPVTLDTRHVVKLGTHKFSWNDTYDHLEESEESRNKRRQNSGLNSARAAEEAAIISQQNQPRYISDEELFG